MNTTQSLLDEALRLGDLELQMLAHGEVDQAEQTALQRSELLDKALHGKQVDALQDAASDELAALRDKLEQLMTMQGQLTGEARKLHSDIRSELMRTRQESARYAGYGKAAGAQGQRGLLHKRS